jgi:hypothetical protein
VSNASLIEGFIRFARLAAIAFWKVELLIASSIARRSASGSWVMKPGVPVGLVTSEEWLRLPSKEARIRLVKGGRVFGPMARVFFDVMLKREEKRSGGEKKEFYLPAAKLLTVPYLVCNSVVANRVWVYLAVL